MPPHLHPRSRLTSSLFATTLFASFFVVALPHVLPCPAPRTILYADDGTPIPRKRRRRPVVCGNGATDGPAVEENSEVDGDVEDEGLEGGKRVVQRECPIPKPGGIMGEILGFKSSTGEGKNKPP